MYRYQRDLSICSYATVLFLLCRLPWIRFASVSYTHLICLPTYNRSKVIERQVKDIIAQTAEIEDDIEVLLSDNASTDDTRIPVSYTHLDVYKRQ